MEREHFLALLQNTGADGCNELRTANHLNGAIILYNAFKPEFHIHLTPTTMVDVEDAISVVVWVADYGIPHPYVYSVSLPISVDKWDEIVDWKSLTNGLQTILLKYFQDLFSGTTRSVVKLLFSRNHPKIDYTVDEIVLNTTEGEVLFTFYKTLHPNTAPIEYQGKQYYVDVVDLNSSQCVTYIPLVAAYWDGRLKAKSTPVVTSIGSAKKQTKVGE